jgi:hypothetical protein
MTKRAKFLKLTATVHLDDGTQYEFLNVNGDKVVIASDEPGIVRLGMGVLGTVVEQYEQDPRRPENLSEAEPEGNA